MGENDLCPPSLHRVPCPDTTEDGLSFVVGAGRCQPVIKNSPGEKSPGLSALYRLSFSATARRGERTSFCADSATCFGVYQSLAWLSHLHPMSRSTFRNGKVLPVIAIISSLLSPRVGRFKNSSTLLRGKKSPLHPQG